MGTGEKPESGALGQRGESLLKRVREEKKGKDSMVEHEGSRRL